MTLPGFVLLLVLCVVYVVKPTRQWWHGSILFIACLIYGILGGMMALRMNDDDLFWTLFLMVMVVMEWAVVFTWDAQ